MHFNKIYYHEKKYLKLQIFTDDKQYKKNDKLFKNLTKILDTSKLTLEFNTILYKVSEIYHNFDESYSSLLLLNISDLVKYKEDYKNNDATPED